MALPSRPEDAIRSVIFQPWESKQQWEARIQFIEDHLERYPFEKLTSLSMVWANMNFLRCRYPPETEALVSSYPLPRQPRRRNLQGNVFYFDRVNAENDLSEDDDRFSQVSLMIDTARKKSEARLDMIPESAKEVFKKSESLLEIPAATKEVFKKSESLLEIPVAAREVFKKLDLSWLQRYLSGHIEDHPVCVITNIFDKHKISLDLPIKEVIDENDVSMYQVCLLVDDQLVAKGEVCDTKKTAKRSAADKFVAILKQAMQSGTLNDLVNPQMVEMVQEIDLVSSQSRSPVGGKGREMLQNMGWKADTYLGGGKEGMPTPDLPVGNVTKCGLGYGNVSRIEPQAIREKLINFLQSDSNSLCFPTSLSNEDRRLVHHLAQEVGLAHKAYGSSENRQIVITKKTLSKDVTTPSLPSNDARGYINSEFFKAKKPKYSS